MIHGAKTKEDLRTRRRVRIRAKVAGTTERPRLSVFRSNRYISVQVIDDTTGKTLVAVHSREFKGTPSAQAKAVGEAIAKKAKVAGITSVVFDRGGYQYSGQVKVVAEAAREGGLTF